MIDSLPLTAVVGLAYLLGSIPSGLVVTQLAGLGDIRQIGSGNIGATNVLRTGSKALAALTLLLDIAKGALAVALGGVLSEDNFAGWNAAEIAGLAAILGHLFPVWLSFKGGKGVATYIGVLLGLYWPAALIFCGCWLLVAGIFRYSSLAALISAIIAPIATLFWSSQSLALLFAIISLLLISKHHANIRRLLEGKEPKIGEKS